MKYLKPWSAITITILAVTFAFVACHKSDKENSPSASTSQAELQNFWRQKLANQPSITTDIVNIKGKGYYSDLLGNRIDVQHHATHRDEASSCPDPGDSEVEYEFVSMEREYTCNTGYRFLVTFHLTSEFYIVASNGSNFSTGRVRLRNGSTTIVTTDPAQLLSITNNGVVGTNGNGADLNQFTLVFRTPIVSEANYNASNAIQPSMFLYTDCTNYPTVTVPFTTEVSTDGSQHRTMPCLRVDHVGWNPSSGSGGSYTPPSLSGCNPTGFTCFPTGYVYPQWQEIEFQKSDGTWGHHFNLYVNFLSNPSVNTDKITYLDVFYIDVTNTPDLTPGNVNVRYRNKITNSSNGGPCTSDQWIQEQWFLQ
jgi:hypothetical protein